MSDLQPDIPGDFYRHYRGCWLHRFILQNPEFDTEEFRDFVVAHNKADCDDGELHEIAHHEVLRLAYEFSESRWRFPNCYGEYPLASEQRKIGEEMGVSDERITRPEKRRPRRSPGKQAKRLLELRRRPRSRGSRDRVVDGPSVAPTLSRRSDDGEGDR